MACTQPPELSERQLLAYLDGETDAKTTEHLRLCPHCAGRAEELARLQNALRQNLFRAECPPSQQLGEYHLGLLPAEEAKMIREHMTWCSHCSAEIEGLARYMADLASDLEARTISRVRVLIARLLDWSEPGTGPAPGVPAYAGIRGEAEVPLTYEADGIRITLDLAEDPEAPGRYLMMGLVSSSDTTLPHLTARLFTSDELVATTPVDDLGNFEFAGLERATYHLVLDGPDIEIIIEAVDVQS